MHVELHPSPLIRFPSSQATVPKLNPFPHCSVQIEIELKAEEQVNPNSTVQLELQPSPLIRLPSSHFVESVPGLTPSPQTIDQESLVVGEPPIQVYPDSTMQLLDHPSPLIVFPSSHPAEEYRLPSPHKSSHSVAGILEATVEQLKPDSSLHILDHPSFDTEFPSSHSSTGVLRMPSPQITVHELGVVGLPFLQLQPVSTFQVEEQPSPFAVFPSSHFVEIEEYSLPSPHVSLHVSGVDAEPPVQVNPGSTAQRVHPSRSTVFPSSQSSPLSRTPLPHGQAHTSAMLLPT